MKMTIKEFCRKHSACVDCMKWAVENCKDMDEVWEKANPERLIWVATRKGVLTDKELRLFAVWEARKVQHLMTNERSIIAIDVAERHANGNATDEELRTAWRAARVVAWEASNPSVVALATFKSASVVALAAAWVAREVSREVARCAVWGVVREVRNTVRAADWDATIVAQAEYLRKNCKPNFNR